MGNQPRFFFNDKNLIWQFIIWINYKVLETSF